MSKRVLSGTVVSDKLDKTIVVIVTRQVRHPKYKKIIKRSKKYSVHDEANKHNVGDIVTIQECRPYSKNKKWIVFDSKEKSPASKEQLGNKE